MNKFFYIITTACILSVTAVSAQSFESGAFAAPVFKYTKLVNQSAFIIGGRGGWIINKRFVLGAGYYTLTSDVKTTYFDLQNNQNVMMNFNYGGLEFEYLLFNNKRFNLSFNMLVAGGGVEFYVPDRSKRYPSTNLLLWEPQLSLEIEIYEWLHADAGVGYRMISYKYDLYDVTKNDLQGINVLLSFKMGKY
jgi:hypothetical protein